MASAVIFLADLCLPGLKADLAINPPIHMLVVDDDLWRAGLLSGTANGFYKPESAENGEAALALRWENLLTLFFWTMVMPGMDGFELCKKTRETVPHRTTPVVFATGQSDFDARKNESERWRRSDEEAIPTSEITVKALTFALRGRLQQIKTQPRL